MHLLPDPSANPGIQAVRTIMDLGNGVNGHPDVCHGGFVATMLDEVMGVLLTINLERDTTRRRGEAADTTLGLFTACERSRGCKHCSPLLMCYRYQD
jgi:hypothetical protein